jgi:chemotaxis signal transduction protein
VLNVAGRCVGFGVDQTYGVVSIDKNSIEDFAHVGDRPVYITGAFHHGDTLTFMIEPEEFFSEAFTREWDKVKSFHEENARNLSHETIH